VAKIEIPGILHNINFRFVLLESREKRPIQQAWTTENNYFFFDETLQQHIASGGNYGVMGGWGGLVILDADTPAVAESVKQALPSTFTVRTGSGGYHFYFICPELKKPIRLYQGKENVGDIQSWGKMAVGPTCIHPNGNRYEIINSDDIATVSAEEIHIAVKDFLLSKQEVERNYSDAPKILELKKIIDVSKFVERGAELQGPHPVHGSKNNNNFCINQEKNIWHCFRCGTGGGIWEWIAVAEGLIPCHLIHKGAVRQLMPKLKKIAKEKYGAVFEDINKNDVETLISTLLETFNIITLIDSDEMYVYDHARKMYIANGEKIIKAYLANDVNEYINRHTYHEIIHGIQGRTYIQRDQLNPPYILPLQNGILDMSTKELLPHSPAYFTSYISPIMYVPDQNAPLFKKFLSEVAQPEDIPEIQKMFGYCLLNSQKFQKAFLFVGSGSNGKSVLLNVLADLLGKQNVSTLSLHEIEKEKFALPMMYGKMANICADLSSLNIATLKNFKGITGGDYLYLERKFREGVSDRINAKLIFSANEIPYSKEGLDYAVLRRWVIFEFKNRFEGPARDLNLLEKLTTNEEKSGILNWALEGLELLEKEGFRNEEKTKRLIYEYGNPILAFASTKLTLEEDSFISRDELYNSFLEYIQENYENLKEKPNQTTFTRRIQPFLPLGVKEDKRKINGITMRGWYNLKIKN